MLQYTTKYCMLHTYYPILHACMLEQTGRGGVAWEGEEREQGEMRKGKKKEREERGERGERKKGEEKGREGGRKKEKGKEKGGKNIKARPASSPLRRPPGGGDNSAEQPKS